MTKKKDAINFIGFWRPLMPPPPLSPDATILNYLNDSERGAPLSFVGFRRPPMPPLPDATILNCLNDRERGGGAPLSFCKILSPPNAPHDSKILYYLNDTNEGCYYFCRFLAPPNAHPPDATILNYLTDREGEGRALPFVGFWRPPPRRHNT